MSSNLSSSLESPSFFCHFTLVLKNTELSTFAVCIKVGQPVTELPPHKSRRAELPHRAFQSYSLRTRSLGS
jgi:hypothetical protein